MGRSWQLARVAAAYTSYKGLCPLAASAGRKLTSRRKQQISRRSGRVLAGAAQHSCGVARAPSGAAGASSPAHAFASACSTHSAYSAYSQLLLGSFTELIEMHPLGECIFYNINSLRSPDLVSYFVVACSALAFAPHQHGLVLAAACSRQQFSAGASNGYVQLWEAAGKASSCAQWTLVSKVEVGGSISKLAALCATCKQCRHRRVMHTSECCCAAACHTGHPILHCIPSGI